MNPRPRLPVLTWCRYRDSSGRHSLVLYWPAPLILPATWGLVRGTCWLQDSTLPFSSTHSGPPESPWQVSLPPIIRPFSAARRFALFPLFSTSAIFLLTDKFRASWRIQSDKRLWDWDFLIECSLLRETLGSRPSDVDCWDWVLSYQYHISKADLTTGSWETAKKVSWVVGGDAKHKCNYCITGILNFQSCIRLSILQFRKFTWTFPSLPRCLWKTWNLRKKLIRGCLTPIILFFVKKGLPFPFLRSVFEQSKIDGADEACTQLYLRIQSQLGSNLGMVFQKILQ